MARNTEVESALSSLPDPWLVVSLKTCLFIGYFSNIFTKVSPSFSSSYSLPFSCKGASFSFSSPSLLSYSPSSSYSVYSCCWSFIFIDSPSVPSISSF